MQTFLLASGISVGLIVLCTVIFYEILAHIWVTLPKLEGRPRLQILFTILSTFIGHTACVWIFGLCYYVLDIHFNFGSLHGDAFGVSLLKHIYFSAVSYSSLGLGDVYPTGELQLLVGVEAIMGLIFIGWTVTFTYLVTEKYLFHRRSPHR